MNNKFISVEGYGKIQNLETTKNRKSKNKNTNSIPLTILLSIVYYLVFMPCKAIKEFSFKEWKSSLTPKKIVTSYVTPVVSIVLLVLTIGYWTNYLNFGLTVKCKGQTVASVTDSAVLEKAKEITNDKLSDDVDANFVPVYQVAMVDDNSTNAEEVSSAMVSTDESISENVAGLYINGKLIGVCNSAKELNDKLDSLLSDDVEYYDDETEVGFYNEVEVREGIFSNDDITSVDDIIKKAEKSDLLQIIVKTDIVVTEKVPFDTKVKYDKNKDASYEKVTKKGVNGKQKTTYRVSYLDGVQIDATITSVKTVKKPVNKVVVKGKTTGNSDVYTDSVGVSGYMWPVPSVHSISSTYGYREGGEFHTGLDIADGNCYGATIVAARAGTVEWAGYDDSGYGNYVIINHGDGYKTLYGHCSAVYVSQGQHVSQGQSISAIGSTGWSTGNHLHFEVRTGDDRSDRQNPLDYVSN